MGLKRQRADTITATHAPEFSNPASSSTGNANTENDVKIVHLDANVVLSSRTLVITCSLPPHQPMSFTSYEAYDVHYQKTHMHRCAECHRNFPDEHFLHLHIAENHDPISAARRERGEKTYACLLPTCPRHCSTPFKRRLHCIDAHAFPKNYDFFIVNTGIDHRTSMLRPPRRQSGTNQSASSQSVPNSNIPRKSKSKGKSKEKVEVVGAVDEMDMDPPEQDQDEAMNTTTNTTTTADNEPRSTPAAQRTPIKLHGRGGFRRPRAPKTPAVLAAGTPSAGLTSPPTEKGGGKEHINRIAEGTEAGDPMEGLLSRMSALQFVPHSVHMARGRGGTRGGRGQG